MDLEFWLKMEHYPGKDIKDILKMMSTMERKYTTMQMEINMKENLWIIKEMGIYYLVNGAHFKGQF